MPCKHSAVNDSLDSKHPRSGFSKVICYRARRPGKCRSFCWLRSMELRQGLESADYDDPPASHVEPEMHHIALAHDVLLPFEPELPRFLRARLALVGNVVVVGDDLGADEAVLEVGVNHAGGLGRRGALLHGPGARFLRSGGKVSLQSEERVAGADHAIESRLLELQLLQKSA